MNLPVEFSPQSPLGRLVDEAIFKFDLQKMQDLLQKAPINLNQRYLTRDADCGYVYQDNPIGYLIELLGDKLYQAYDGIPEKVLNETEDPFSESLEIQAIFKKGIEMMELLIKNGAKFDEEVIFDCVFGVHWANFGKSCQEQAGKYFLSKKDLLIAPISPNSFKESLSWGYDMLFRLNILLKLGAPLNKATGIFDEYRFFYGADDSEIFDVIKALQVNGYCMQETWCDDAQSFSTQNLLSRYAKKDPASSPLICEIIKFLVPIFINDFRNAFAFYSTEEDVFERGFSNYSSGSKFYEPELRACIGNGVYYTEEMLRNVMPFILEYDPQIFSRNRSQLDESTSV